MKVRSAMLVLSCALTMACGGEETPAAEAPAAPPAPVAPAVAPAPVAPAAAPAPVAPAAAVAPAAGAPIVLAGPGFTATPVRGTAGGPVAGETMSAECIGNFPAAPQHTVTVGAAIPLLRVLVNGGAEADTTLAVRRPDGTYACADDSGDPENSFNPLLELANATPGDYQVFVGGYSLGDSWAAYHLTFNEAAGVYPSAAAPAP
jgi:hypothetical protein